MVNNNNMCNPIEGEVFSDEQIERIAKELGIAIPQPEVKDPRIKIGVKELEKMEKLGTGFVRHAHNIWKLEKSGDELFLRRMKGEDEAEEN